MQPRAIRSILVELHLNNAAGTNLAQEFHIGFRRNLDVLEKLAKPNNWSLAWK